MPDIPLSENIKVISIQNFASFFKLDKISKEFFLKLIKIVLEAKRNRNNETLKSFQRLYINPFSIKTG